VGTEEWAVVARVEVGEGHVEDVEGVEGVEEVGRAGVDHAEGHCVHLEQSCRNDKAPSYGYHPGAHWAWAWESLLEESPLEAQPQERPVEAARGVRGAVRGTAPLEGTQPLEEVARRHTYKVFGSGSIAWEVLCIELEGWGSRKDTEGRGGRKVRRTAVEEGIGELGFA